MMRNPIVDQLSVGEMAELAEELLTHFAPTSEVRTYTDLPSLHELLRSRGPVDYGFLVRVIRALEGESLLVRYPNQPAGSLQHGHYLSSWSAETIAEESAHGRFRFLFGGMPALFAEVQERVVAVVGVTSAGDETAGTGLLLASDMVLTAAHCATDVVVPTVVLADETRLLVSGYRVASSGADLALLYLSEPTSVVPLPPPQRMRPPVVPEEGLLVGFPLVPHVRRTPVASVGQVSAIADDYVSSTSVLLVDVASAGGNSGGPLFGRDGYLLGIASRRSEQEVADHSGNQRTIESPFLTVEHPPFSLPASEDRAADWSALVAVSETES